METRIDNGKKLVLFIVVHIVVGIFVLAMEASFGMARLTLGLTGAAFYIFSMDKLFTDHTLNSSGVPKVGKPGQAVKQLLEDLAEESANAEEDLNDFLRGAVDLKNKTDQLFNLTGDPQLKEFSRQLDDLSVRLENGPVILSSIAQTYKQDLEEIEAREGETP